MPELPEVETIVRELNYQKIVGLTIVKVEVHHPKVLEGISSNEFMDRIVNQKFKSIVRRGKYLVFQMNHDCMLVHLRMTGKIFFSPPTEKHLKHVHLKLHLDDGRIIYYEDPRRFGRWFLTSGTCEKLKKLGIEPLSSQFTPIILHRLLNARATQIKPFLLNQNFIAGLGNIYVDEALWEAKIYPTTLTNTISVKQSKILHQAIQKVLQKGIDNQGTTLGNLSTNYLSTKGKRGDNQETLRVFGRQGLPCYRCGNLIKKATVAQRGTHFCPKCQKK